jgi:hypothetical protein
VQSGKLARQLEDVPVAGERVEQDTASGDSVISGRPFPGRHNPDSKAKPPTACHGRPADPPAEFASEQTQYSAPLPARSLHRFLAAARRA